MSEKICNGNIQTFKNGEWTKIGNFELSEVCFENPNAPNFKGFGFIEVKGEVFKIYLNGWIPQHVPYYNNTTWVPKNSDHAPIAVVQKTTKKLPKGKVPIPQ